MTKVYVATAFKEFKNAKEARKILKRNRIACTSRWIDVAANVVPKAIDVPFEYLQKEAKNDVEDLHNSDALLLLVPEGGHKGRGMWFEMGVCFESATPIYCVGTAYKYCVFGALGSEFDIYHFETVEQAVERIKEDFESKVSQLFPSDRFV